MEGDISVQKEGGWEWMKNQIYCCDCFSFFEKIPDGSVDLILTDPPYGIRYQNHFTKKQKKPITNIWKKRDFTLKTVSWLRKERLEESGT